MVKKTPCACQRRRGARRNQGDHRLPERWNLLTFDDGYRNNLELVVPELNGVPWLIYLATEMIDTGGRMPSYRARAR